MPTGELSDHLWDAADDAEGAMWDRFKAELSFWQKRKDKCPFFVVSEFLSLLKAEFSFEVRDLVDLYYRYWSLGERGISLKKINADRQHLHDKYLESDQSICPICATEFLTGIQPWKTQQDGVFYYLCLDLRHYGIAEDVLLDAMKSATKVRL